MLCCFAYWAKVSTKCPANEKIANFKQNQSCWWQSAIIVKSLNHVDFYFFPPISGISKFLPPQKLKLSKIEAATQQDEKVRAKTGLSS